MAGMRVPARWLSLVILVLAACASACGPTVDLRTGLKLDIVSTGWLDVGIVDGKTKLVPSVSFTIKNVSAQTLVALQVNAVFRRNAEKEEWGSGLLMVAGSQGLAPGATTPVQTIKSTLGYTGTESRAEMLQNTEFVDANVRLFAKYGSAQWVPVAEAPITRALVTP
jgi:hypothetical protein